MKVIVKNTIKNKKQRPGWDRNMEQYRGKIIEVEDELSPSKFYQSTIEYGEWYWHKDWIYKIDKLNLLIFGE